ncbi:MAG: cation:proton antiporter [Paludibacteraceae bacterium]|nr:cation:proton antiporter [Paludibacteraceae bacterium]MEE3484149.1 cation:proton antiporter [Bacteroidales bacterium]
MNIPPLIADLALILISAGVTTILFKWLKQPVVLGYIVAGCLVSSQISLTPSVSGASDIGTWADIGVIFLLFSLGLDFSFKKLLNVGRTAIIAALVIVSFMIILGFLVGLAMGWGITNSVLLGGMISMSSTAIIIKAFDDMGLRSQKFTKLVFGILIFEDLIAIVLMVLISTIFVGKSFEGTELIYGILKLVFFLVVWLIAGIYFVPIILKKAKNVLNDETLLVFSLGLCFCMVLFAMNVGFSSALGAFVMGSVMAETLEAERVEKIVRPVKDLFGAIFFVSVGMMVNFTVIIEYAFPIFILVLTIVIGQIVFASMGLILSGQSLKVAIQSGFCLTQIGEFAFIIAMLGTKLGIIDNFIYPVIVAVSVITIFITPYMMKLTEPAYNFLEKRLPENWKKHIEARATAGKSAHNENMWQVLLLEILRIVAVYSILSIAIIILSINYILPIITESIPGIWGKILAASLTILFIAPLQRALVAKKNHSIEYKYLWAANKFNRAPLVILIILRFTLAFGFVAFVLIRTFNAKVGITVFIACVIVLLMMVSKRLKLYSIKLERKFLHNLNSREYEQDKKVEKESGYKKGLASQLSSYDVHLVDYIISQNAICIGKKLKDLNYRKKFGIHIVSILRGNKRINIPGGEVQLFPLDKILVLGTDEQLEKFQNEIKIESVIPEGANRNVSIEQFEITANSPFLGKTLENSGIREKDGCTVVGIERNGISTMNPESQTIFCKGDFVWVVGETESIRKLIAKEDSVTVMEEC